MTETPNYPANDPQQIIAELQRKLNERTAERDEATSQQAATADILKVISRPAFDLQLVLDALVESVAKLCDTDRAVLIQKQGDQYYRVALQGFPANAIAEMKGVPVDLKGGSVAARALRNCTAIHVADVNADPGYPGTPAQSLGGVRTVLSVPLVRETQPVGAITVSRIRVEPFTEKQIDLIKTFADQAVIAIENARLFNEVQAKSRDLTEALSYQAGSSNILKVIASSPTDVDPVLKAVVESACELCNADDAIVQLRDGDTLRHSAHHGPIPVGLERAAINRNFATGRAIIDKVPIHVHDALSDEGAAFPEAQERFRRHGIRSFLCVPLMRENESIGAILLRRTEVRPFSDKQIALLQTFADQAVIAIGNVRLFNETQDALERQTATADILKVIASSPTNIQPVFDAIAERSNRLIGGHATAVYRFVGEIVQLEAFTPVSAEADAVLKASYPRPISGELQFELVREGKIAQIADTDSENVAAITTATARARGWRSVIFMPLIGDAGVIGAITVTRKEAGAFADHHVRLLQTFADQALIAIENARLFNETQDALDRLTATADILKVIASSPTDVQPVFDVIVERAVQLCGARMGRVYRYDGNLIHMVGGHGLSVPGREGAQRPFPRPAADDTIVGRVMLSRRPNILADLNEDETVPPLSRRMIEALGARSQVTMPMLLAGEPIGAITLSWAEPRGYNDHQIALLQTFADQAVIAIGNVRLFNETQEALERQTATADILKVIASSPTDVQPVFDAIAASANRLLGGFSTAVFRFVDDIAHLAAFTPTTPPADKVLQSSFPMPLANFEQFELAKDGQPVQTPDIEQMSNRRIKQIARMRGFRSMLFVPLMNSGIPIGIISVTRLETGSFGDHHVQLLQTFADQAVIAIENVRLFEAVQTKTRHLEEALQIQTATSEVLKVISRSPDALQPVLDAIAKTACELCGSDGVTIFLLRDEKFHFTAVSGAVPKHLEYLRANPTATDEPTSVFGQLMLKKRTIHYANVFDHPELDQERIRLGGERALLMVPLLRDDQMLGVIVLRQSHLRPFTPPQIQAIEVFADQAVIAISNVGLFEQVQRRTFELSQSLDELRAAQDRLLQTEKLASLGQLTAGIAHEIKNPLNFVNNFSALTADLTDELKGVLRSAALSDKIREEIDDLTRIMKDNLEKIVQHGKRADSIVKNMLLHSREGSGEHRPVEINAILDESLNLAYHGARAEKPGFSITLQRDFDSATGMADVYPQEITRVLLNLISNGFYAATRRAAETGDGFEPTLRAATKNLGDKIEIRIRDNGTGIAREVKEKIFNPFFTTKPAGEGTGLGLSISHDIVVKQHGGTIGVDTEPGIFTEFIITLPRTLISRKTAGGTN